MPERLLFCTAGREHQTYSVVRGLLDHRSNAFVEAIHGQMQQAKRAARGFRTAANLLNDLFRTV